MDILHPLLSGFIPDTVTDIFMVCYARIMGNLAHRSLHSVKILQTPRKAWLAWKTDAGVEIRHVNNKSLLEVLKFVYPCILESVVSRVIHSPVYGMSMTTTAKMILGEFSRKVRYREYGTTVRDMSLYDVIRNDRVTATSSAIAQEFLDHIPPVKICRKILQS